MCVTHQLDESVCFPQLSVIKARAGLPGGKLTLRVNLVLVEELELPAEAAEQLHDGPHCKTREARPMPAQEECTAAETSHRPAP